MPEEKRENFFTELLKFAFVAIVIVVPVRLWVAQPFIVSGESMSPTFESGQYLIVDELTYHLQNPQRGDVIIFRYPKNPSEFFIKRIIGLPGEKVYVSDQSITVVEKDGLQEKLSEPYLLHTGNGTDEVITLQDNQYFVMGDNRPDSSDSRFWGPVSRNLIIGRALLRLLPPPAFSLFPGVHAFPPPSKRPSGTSFSTFQNVNLPQFFAQR